MTRIYIVLILIVCTIMVVGRTLSCEECGHECAHTCGTRAFRACCFNAQKRAPNVGLRLWFTPPKESDRLRFVYDS